MKTKAYTIALLFAGTAFTAQAQATSGLGQTYDPVNDYYGSYYGLAEVATAQADSGVHADVRGQTYDPVSDYYESYYGVSEAAAVTPATKTRTHSRADANAQGQSYDPVSDYYETYYGIS